MGPSKTFVFGLNRANLTLVKAGLLGAAALAIVVLFPCTARADGLRIETIEQGTWPAAVAALQRDRESEGHNVHVVVKDDVGARLLCGTYSLVVEGSGSDAFVVGACDENTNATSVRLARRAALFDHDDAVPRPRAPRVTATRVQSGSVAGGAKQGAGSVVLCTADVRPFLDDMERGARVALTPGRYELHASAPDVDVAQIADGWRITTHGAASVPYFVVDGRRNEIVFRDRVTVSCSTDGESAAGGMPLGTSAASAELPRGNDATTPANRPLGDWNGNAWTISVTGGIAYLRPSGVIFGNGSDAEDASLFGLRDYVSSTVGLAASYERTGIYSSIGGHIAWVGLNGKSLFHYGVMSTVATALHFGDLTIYLGPNVQFGTYQLTGVGPSNWGTRAAFNLGAAAGLRIHLRDDDGKAWVLGGEVVAPVAGASEPWFFTASIGWGGAN